LAVSGCDQIIQNEIGVALPNPPGFVFTSSMLEIEHRVAYLYLRVVIGRQINQRVPPSARHLRVVPNLAYLTLRNILNRVIRRAGFRNFYHAGVLPTTEKRLAVRVADLCAINDERVVMQTGDERQ